MSEKKFKQTDSNFKLSKQTKALMATFPDAHARGHFKRMMIDAQVAANQRPAKESK